ncbi:MAG: peptidase [Rheinheimera sp.]|nr:MAG: peptidase [Rheinheimera sp.]
MDFLPATALTFSPLLAFALLLLVGALGGYLAHLTRWIPSITGFMAVGFLIGPSGLGLLDKHTLADARILVDIALALILYRLGTSLDLRFIRQHKALVLTSLAEASVTFIACFFVLHWLDFSPVLAALISAILISSSPAVLLHVAHETGAKGPVTETAKTLVALNNCWSFLVFAAVIPALLLDQQAGLGQVILQPLYLLIGSACLGVLIGVLLHFLCLRTQTAAQYKMALVIGSLMLTLALAQQLQLSALFAPLLVGITVRSLERGPLVSELNFGAAFELFFIVLFVFAGAKLQLSALWQYGLVIVSLVLVRSTVKVLMLWLAGTVQRQPARASSGTGMLLVPMAGLAIGLAQTSSGLSTEHAAVISAVVLGAVTLFETIGPPLAAFAFRFAGEAGQAHDDDGLPPQRLSQPDSWSVPGPLVQMRWRGNVSGSADIQPADVPAIITDTDLIAGARTDAVSPANKTTKLSRLFKWRRSGV